MVRVVQIPRESNPADLMTKYLGVDTVTERLKAMNIRKVLGNAVKREGPKDRREKGQEVVKKRWADEDGGAGEEACLEVVEWWKLEEKK